MYDTDAFYVPSGYDAVHCATICNHYRATGWHKVVNAVNWHIAIARE